MGPAVPPGPHRLESLVDGYQLYPKVWGVFVGQGCVTGEDPLEWRTIEAHAHVAGDLWEGWICIADPRSVITRSGKASQLLIHEIGHIWVGDASHGRKWQEVVSRLGATKEANKYARTRKRTNNHDRRADILDTTRLDT